jgi:hypothetical protein
MDENMVLIMAMALPFYAIGVISVGYLAAFAYHKAKTLGDSAQEQQITEQVPYQQPVLSATK